MADHLAASKKNFKVHSDTLYSLSYEKRILCPFSWECVQRLLPLNTTPWSSLYLDKPAFRTAPHTPGAAEGGVTGEAGAGVETGSGKL